MELLVAFKLYFVCLGIELFDFFDSVLTLLDDFEVLCFDPPELVDQAKRTLELEEERVLFFECSQLVELVLLVVGGCFVRGSQERVVFGF